MSDFRIKAQKTGPRSFLKELQMISYRGGALYTESGSPLIAEKKVYYPPDYLASSATAVVLDSESFELNGLSLRNNSRKGRPAALPIEEQFKDGSAVSRSLLGIDRAETQQGLFGNVSSYGLDKKDWVAYAAWPDSNQGDNWESKNSPAGPHRAAVEFDDAKNSAIGLLTYPVPYYNPGNAPVSRALSSGTFTGQAPAGWVKYIQSLVAMYIIEYMVNNFDLEKRRKFRLEYIEDNYPKTSDQKFNRLYWDRIWIDINQSRVGRDGNIPIIPLGEFRNFGALSSVKDGADNPDYKILDLTDEAIFGDGKSIYSDLSEVSTYFGNFFSASTRYVWTEPDNGHYRLKTNTAADLWSEYWGMDYANLPQDLKDWEFRVLTSEPAADSPEEKYKLPYYLISDSDTANESLIFGASWPKTYSDTTIPQISTKLTEGNIVGSRPSNYAIQTLQSTRAFRYQPGRISGFTYGVRVSEEGAGPGTILEFGVENYSDGYFFRLKDGTDFSIVRRSTVPLGVTEFFVRAGYIEREAFVNRLTGRAQYRELLSASQIVSLEESVREGSTYVIYETAIEQNQMNGDGLNNQGPSGYIYNPDTVTMYKIEFGWYGAIGARFYAYIPQGGGESRWVTLHTLVIENQIGQPCLEDPYFFFKYRVWTEEPSAIRIPQFVEKYGASYYIDGGDEGTVSIGSGSAVNRKIEDAVVADYAEGTDFPISKWGTVLGLKTRKKIINSVGNEFFNKKEIYPVSISIASTKNLEIKFVNQYGCQEHAHTFQEGFRCILPESQRLRGKFLIKSLEVTESNLDAIGRTEDPTPTITWLGPADGDTNYNLSVGGVATGAFIGWNGVNSLNKGLLGTKIIADKVYQAYVNPTENTGFIDSSNVTTVLARNTRTEQFYNTFKRFGGWSDGQLLFRYPTTGVDVKLSPFRRDTTIMSTIPIETEEFFLLFTSTRTGAGYDTYDQASSSIDYEARCDGGGRCDGKHAADMQIGLVWPYGDASDTTYTYPKYHTHVNNVGSNFGVLMPNDTAAQSYSNWDNKDVELVEDTGNSDWYVRDKQIPNSDNFRYYEGLPVDFENRAFKDNTIIASSTGWVLVGNSLEVGEGLGNDLGQIDSQLPGVPGEDGGACRALFCKAGLIEELGKFIASGSNFYLSKSSRWDAGLASSPTTLFAENDSFTVNTYVSTGADQTEFILPGTAIKEFWLPVTPAAGSAAFANNEEITAKYRAIAMYEPSLLNDTAKLIDRKVTGADPFPLKFFIKMREGAEIGSVIIAKKTTKGFISQPFTPHGCSVSQSNTGTTDSHNGGANNTDLGATKAIGIFSHPGVLNPALSYSYLDTRTDINNPTDRTKKCYSFLSRSALEGAGFSGTGDYPLRFLKFKDSGDPVGAFYISANKPQEISLKEIFNYNGEAVTPSFWSNKALFMIARDIGTTAGGGDNTTGFPGKASVTLNYKEQ